MKRVFPQSMSDFKPGARIFVKQKQVSMDIPRTFHNPAAIRLNRLLLLNPELVLILRTVSGFHKGRGGNTRSRVCKIPEQPF